MLYNENAATILAHNILKPLKPYYAAEGMEEIVVNTPGEVWLKKKRGPWECVEASELTYDYFARRLCPVMAHINNSEFSEEHIPIVSCEIPNEPFRFQCVVGNNVRYELGDRKGVALAIRSLRGSDEFSFADYGLGEEENIENRNVFDDFSLDMADLKKIQAAITNQMSIVVSGPTSSGKTTFLKQLVKLIDTRLRVITVEDTREIIVPGRNRIHFVVSRNIKTNQIGYNQVIDAIMRLTPDIVICGEVSTSNAAPLYALMGKGHPVWTTVHAGNPEEAIAAFATNMMTNKDSSDSRLIMDSLNRQIGCIIQLTKKRQVSSLSFPAMISSVK